ncbi:MAG TPA: hypothetical protein PLO69_14225 [Gammaproteobacteria bacterium]|nr:hypothetical protein [Gammaproteobacteria bacterium]
MFGIVIPDRNMGSPKHLASDFDDTLAVNRVLRPGVEEILLSFAEVPPVDAVE